MSLLETKRASGVDTKFYPGIYDEFIKLHNISIPGIYHDIPLCFGTMSNML